MDVSVTATSTRGEQAGTVLKPIGVVVAQHQNRVFTKINLARTMADEKNIITILIIRDVTNHLWFR